MSYYALRKLRLTHWAKAQRLFVSLRVIRSVPIADILGSDRQAVDVAGLKATSIQSIITICTVLGFLAHGYVTEEFEVTEERLGVYLPTEHIDNPKCVFCWSFLKLSVAWKPGFIQFHAYLIAEDIQRMRETTIRSCADPSTHVNSRSTLEQA